MKSKICRIWVSDEFERVMKKEALNRRKTLIETSKDLAYELEDKKTESNLRKWKIKL